jgi:Phage head-tail joining protein
MVHSESISVYKYQKAPDGYYEFTPAAPVLQLTAPSYATINQSTGGDVIISERMATSNVFEIFTNYRADFAFTRDMFIVDYAGNIYDIEDIVNMPEKNRKRLVKLECSYISGVDYTGSGGGGTVAGLNTLYYTVPADSATLDLSALANATVYLAFRDGNEKTVVTSNPQINQIMVVGTILSLVSGDIFYGPTGDNPGERITILYQ